MPRRNTNVDWQQAKQFAKELRQQTRALQRTVQELKQAALAFRDAQKTVAPKATVSSKRKKATRAAG
jgi:transposase-like protein